MRLEIHIEYAQFVENHIELGICNDGRERRQEKIEWIIYVVVLLWFPCMRRDLKLEEHEALGRKF